MWLTQSLCPSTLRSLKRRKRSPRETFWFLIKFHSGLRFVTAAARYLVHARTWHQRSFGRDTERERETYVSIRKSLNFLRASCFVFSCQKLAGGHSSCHLHRKRRVPHENRVPKLFQSSPENSSSWVFCTILTSAFHRTIFSFFVVILRVPQVSTDCFYFLFFF